MTILAYSKCRSYSSGTIQIVAKAVKNITSQPVILLYKISVVNHVCFFRVRVDGNSAFALTALVYHFFKSISIPH